MTRATAAKEKAARLAAQRHAPVVDPATVDNDPKQAQPATFPSPQPRQAADNRKIRMTLDLTPALYDDFEDWRRTAARQLGRGRVQSVEVLRLLLRELLAKNSELSPVVIDALRREGRP